MTLRWNHFVVRTDGGADDIVNIGSIVRMEPYIGGSIYCATRAAIGSFTDRLQKMLVATRIRIIEIDPGLTKTNFSVVMFHEEKTKADTVYTGAEPLTPDDIAEIIVFAAGQR